MALKQQRSYKERGKRRRPYRLQYGTSHSMWRYRILSSYSTAAAAERAIPKKWRELCSWEFFWVPGMMLTGPDIAARYWKRDQKTNELVECDFNGQPLAQESSL